MATKKDEITKSQVFTQLGKVAQQARQTALENATQRTTLKAQIAQLETSTAELGDEFKSASLTETEEHCLAIYRKKAEQEAVLEIRRAKLEKLEDEPTRGKQNNEHRNAIIKAGEEAHNYAVDQLMPVIRALYDLMKETGEQERAAYVAMKEVNDLYGFADRYGSAVELFDGFQVHRSARGSELFKALERWLSCYDGTSLSGTRGAL